MRFHPLNEEQKEYLELRHRYEGDKRVADRIKAVLLKNDKTSTFRLNRYNTLCRSNVQFCFLQRITHG